MEEGGRYGVVFKESGVMGEWRGSSFDNTCMRLG